MAENLAYEVVKRALVGLFTRLRKELAMFFRKNAVLFLLAVILVFPLFGCLVEKPLSICPRTKMVSDCLSCHTVPDFRVKESRPDAHLGVPGGLRILDYPSNPKGYILVGDIDYRLSGLFFEAFEYLKRHHIKYVVLDIHSKGGSLFDAWRIKSLIDEFILDGGIVETNLRSMALSAGAIIFVAGSDGYRVANPQSEFMIHEVGIYRSGTSARITPSSTDEVADALKHIQKTVTDWLATRGKLTAQQIERLIEDGGELWLSGREAFELGFVDRLIGVGGSPSPPKSRPALDEIFRGQVKK